MEPEVRHIARFFLNGLDDVVIDLETERVESLSADHPFYDEHWKDAWALQYEETLVVTVRHREKDVQLTSEPVWKSALHVIECERVAPTELFENYRELYSQTHPDNLGSYIKFPTGELRLLSKDVVILSMPGKVLEREEKVLEREEIERKVQAAPHSAVCMGELDWSVRTYNLLEKGRIRTVGDLLLRSEKDLMNIRNFGRKSLVEVYEKLQALGYKFEGGDEIFPWCRDCDADKKFIERLV